MTGEELGLKLLQSILEMKTGNAARVTKVEPNEVAAARQQSEPQRGSCLAQISPRLPSRAMQLAACPR